MRYKLQSGVAVGVGGNGVFVGVGGIDVPVGVGESVGEGEFVGVGERSGISSIGLPKPLRREVRNFSTIPSRQAVSGMTGQILLISGKITG